MMHIKIEGTFKAYLRVPLQDTDETDEEYKKFVEGYIYDELLGSINRHDLEWDGWTEIED
jgi:hypothetical protein